MTSSYTMERDDAKPNTPAYDVVCSRLNEDAGFDHVGTLDVASPPDEDPSPTSLHGPVPTPHVPRQRTAQTSSDYSHLHMLIL
jgi:hypothetical protein